MVDLLKCSDEQLTIELQRQADELKLKLQKRAEYKALEAKDPKPKQPQNRPKPPVVPVESRYESISLASYERAWTLSLDHILEQAKSIAGVAADLHNCKLEVTSNDYDGESFSISLDVFVPNPNYQAELVEYEGKQKVFLIEKTQFKERYSQWKKDLKAWKNRNNSPL